MVSVFFLLFNFFLFVEKRGKSVCVEIRIQKKISFKYFFLIYSTVCRRKSVIFFLISHSVEQQFCWIRQTFSIVEREKHFSFLNFHRETYTILFLSRELNFVKSVVLLSFVFFFIYEMHTHIQHVCEDMGRDEVWVDKFVLKFCIKFDGKWFFGAVCLEYYYNKIVLRFVCISSVVYIIMEWCITNNRSFLLLLLPVLIFCIVDVDCVLILFIRMFTVTTKVSWICMLP